MGVRYIGSKTRVAGEIARLVGPPQESGVFVDGFCGAGTVASAVAAFGWPVRLNDHLLSSATMAVARLTGRESARFDALGGYAEAIRALNDLEGIGGFIHREYTPASLRHSPHERRYFTEANGRRIDAVRSTIRLWREAGLLTDSEHHLLIADLMVAANTVANIAGTYGCYLSRWTPQSLRDIWLHPRTLSKHGTSVDLYVGDVTEIPISADDVVYYDPPYTKRQYAAYYHLLETIAWGDEPVVLGVTGLRPWKHLASAFCYSSRALRSLTSLVADTPSRRVLLSYSSEGHVSRAVLERALAPIGDLVVHELGQVGRYRPNTTASAAGHEVHEYLFEIIKDPVLAEVRA